LKLGGQRQVKVGNEMHIVFAVEKKKNLPFFFFLSVFFQKDGASDSSSFLSSLSILKEFDFLSISFLFISSVHASFLSFSFFFIFNGVFSFIFKI